MSLELIFRKCLGWSLAAIIAFGAIIALAENANENQPWEILETSDSSTPTGRHEAAAVVWNNRILLMGGRGTRPVDSFDPQNKTWTVLPDPPLEIHHFQPVVWNNLVYLVSGMLCCYPDEPSLTHVQIYNPQTNTWSEGAEIPESRRRGGAGSVVYNNRIYILGGNTLGHNGGAVAWFDEYDPATDTWTVLPDAPDARDHFFAVLVDDELIAAGGRQTTQPDPFANTVAATNIYNFTSGSWRSGASIPTQRAGAMAVGFGSEAIVIGGEISASTAALDKVEAYDASTDQWRALQSLQIGRHSGGAVLLDDELHVISGNAQQGGGGETDTHELLDLDPVDPPPVDSDVDGLTDDDELNIYGTQPDDADSDDDQLDDGREITLGTDPALCGLG